MGRRKATDGNINVNIEDIYVKVFGLKDKNSLVRILGEESTFNLLKKGLLKETKSSFLNL